jgi:hypothetical protein
MHYRFRRRAAVLAAILGAAMTLILAGTAQADPGVTVAIGSSATLQSRVLLTLPITVSCDPVGDFFTMSFVSVEQAAGTQIARGTGFNFPQPICDSTSRTYPVSVLADPSGPPFHGGQAVAFASVNIFGSLGSEGGSAGPQTISVRGH